MMNLKRLSAHLGLSMTTVSRALNGYPEVSERTRSKVIAAADKFGYRPDPVARRLASGKAEAVGVVMPLPAGQFADPFFVELLAGIGERLHRVEIDLMVSAAPAGPEEMRAYRRLVEGRRVDGLLVARTRRHDERIEYLLDRGIPFVTHGQTESDRPYSWFDMDNEQGFVVATERLMGFGHRRIALVNAPIEMNFAYLRWRGYERALSAFGLDGAPELVVEGEATEAGGWRLANRLLDLEDPPTAILCANVLSAIGVLKAIRERSLLPGKDISVIAYDDLSQGRFTDPPLTTVNHPTRAAGTRLAEMLLKRMAGTPARDLQELWQPRLTVRKSDGPCSRPNTKQQNVNHVTSMSNRGRLK